MKQGVSRGAAQERAAISIAAGLMALWLQGCTEQQTGPSSGPSATSSAAPTAIASPAAPIDPGAVAAATGGKPEAADGVIKVSFPREDVKVEVDKWAMPPFMGLTSWAAFTPGEKPGVDAMVMG